MTLADRQPVEPTRHPADEPILPGVWLSDLFAAFALATYMSSETAQSQLAREVQRQQVEGMRQARIIEQVMAARAYTLADAMLDERERRAAEQ